MENWQKLSNYRHVRLRTEVFFGSRDPHTQSVLEYPDNRVVAVETTWVPAVFTAFRELLDNALDEVITHGFGNRIEVEYDAETMIISVADNGRGIPINWSEEHGQHAATVLLSEMNSGRNFAERGESRGLNGIGAKGVNYCSEWFQVEITRDHKQFRQTFREGPDLITESPLIQASKTKRTGTKITCKLSREVFPDLRLPERFIAARMREIALCYPNLRLIYNGQPVAANSPFGTDPISFTIDEPEVNACFWLLPDFGSEFTFSLVNGIPLFNGGTHVDAFRRSFYNGLLNGLSTRKLSPSRADVSEGLLVYALLTMPKPNFDSQSKTRLINEGVGSALRKTLDQPTFYRSLIQQNPFWIDAIYARCESRTQSKDDKETKRQAKKNLRQKIEDLEDACGYDRSKCILFLTEGRSAVSGITEARDSNIHGALPMRGKILNCYGESAKTVLANETLAKIMNAIGLVPGEPVNRRLLRYGKVYLTCDADPDGANITALLVCFFYRFWPELFDPDRPAYFHIFETPLLIAVRKKQRRYWYSHDYHTFKADALKGWEIIRAKGLAALEREDWRNALASPQTIPIVDDGAIQHVISLLFSSDTDARKRWIGI